MFKLKKTDLSEKYLGSIIKFDKSRYFKIISFDKSSGSYSRSEIGRSLDDPQLNKLSGFTYSLHDLEKLTKSEHWKIIKKGER